MASRKSLLGVITARMGSTRLPDKCLMKVWRSVSILEMLIRRMRRSKRVSHLVLATTLKEEDLALVREGKRLDLEVFRGSENNLVERFNQLLDSRQESYDYVLRITADNPMTDPALLDEMAELVDKEPYDYVYVRNMPIGLGCEFFNPLVIRRMRSLCLTDAEKEHLSLYLSKNPREFRTHYYEKPGLKDYSDFSFTIDTLEQLEYMRKLLEGFDRPEYLEANDLVSKALLLKREETEKQK